MNGSRRQHLAWLCAAGLTSAWSPRAPAKARPRYGGEVALALPLSAAGLDPHQNDNLAAALLASNLFETLYAKSSSGTPYATLAEGPPELRGQRAFVRLRPDIVSGTGQALEARDVLGALERSQRSMPWLVPLPTGRVEGHDLLSFADVAPDTLALLLASPLRMLIPRDFEALRPTGHGAFVGRAGPSGFVFSQNPWAPRGGALLERVRIQCADLSECLRAFESGESALGWLGDGLYQKRASAVPFALATLGWVYALPGRGLGHLRAPGVLQAALGGTSSRALAGLGYLRSTTQSQRDFPGRSLGIVCRRDSPQILGTAEALAEAWSTATFRISVLAESAADVAGRRKSGDFDVLLDFARTAGLEPRELHALWVHLDGGTPGKNFVAEAPEKLARRLGLGLLGPLAPRGFVLPEIAASARGTGLDFSSLELPRKL